MASIYRRLSSNNYAAVPIGGASAANQVIEIGYLQSIDNEEMAGNVSLMSIDDHTNSAALTLLDIDAKIPSGLTVVGGKLLVDAGFSGNVTVVQPVGTNLHVVVDSSALPVGASTSSIQNTINTSINTLLKPANTLAAVTTLGSITSAVTVIQPTGSNLHVSVDNFPATQPISGSVTVTQATGTNLHTVIDSGSVTFTNTTLAVTGPLTDTQLRATPVAVSGTVSTGGLTDTQLRATPVPVSLTSTTITSSALPTGGATSALQTSGNASLSSIDSKTPVLGQQLAGASQPVVLTAAQLTTLTPLTSVTVTQATGTNLHTVVDSGSITFTNTAITANIGTTNGLALDTSVNTLLKPASTLAAVTTLGTITNAVTVVQPTAANLNATVVGTVAVSNFPTTQGVSLVTAPDQQAMVTITSIAGGGNVITEGRSTVTIDVTGTFVATLVVEAQNINLTWTAVTMLDLSTNIPAVVSSISAPGRFVALSAGYLNVRIRPTAYTSGTATVGIEASIGTQGTYARQAGSWIVQPTMNVGRVMKSYSATFTAAVTEALVTLTPISAGVAGTAGTSFGVTAGKRLIIQSISVSTRNAGAAVQGVVIQLRMTNTGAITTTSPLIGTVGTGSFVASANASNSSMLTFADGLEFTGTMQLGVTQVGTATANNTVTITGYEY